MQTKYVSISVAIPACRLVFGVATKTLVLSRMQTAQVVPHLSSCAVHR
jgi:hypothetical protein